MTRQEIKTAVIASTRVGSRPGTTRPAAKLKGARCRRLRPSNSRPILPRRNRGLTKPARHSAAAGRMLVAATV